MAAAIALLASLAVAGCGYSARDGEAIGQAKKLTTVTPLICPQYAAFDLSLGVMRGGSGSMSTQDIWFTVTNYEALATLRKAVAAGAIVRVRYDTRRFPICTQPDLLTGAEIIQ